MTTTTPRQDDPEICVLGMMVRHETWYRDVIAAGLNQDDFKPSGPNRQIFGAIRTNYDENGGCDLIGLFDSVSGIPINYITNLAGTPLAQDPLYYIEILRKERFKREVAPKLNELSMETSSSVLTRVEDIQEKINIEARLITEMELKVGKKQINTANDDFLGWLEDRVSKCRQGAEPGITCGVRGIDDLIHGWMPGRIYIIGARPAMGKSAFAFQCSVEAGQLGHKVGIISIEMTGAEVVGRLVSNIARVDQDKISSGDLSEHEIDKIMKARDMIHDFGFVIRDDIHGDFNRLKDAIHDAVKVDGCNLIVIDYLQLLKLTDKSKNSMRAQELSEITAALKIMAKQYNVPMIIPAQINREAERDKTQGKVRCPGLSALKDSGSIEQDADVVIILHREDYYCQANETPTFHAIASIAKNRHGKTGMIFMTDKLLSVGRFQDA